MYTLKNVGRSVPPYAFTAHKLSDVILYLKESVEPTLTTDLQKAYIHLVLEYLEEGDVETAQNIITSLGFALVEEKE